MAVSITLVVAETLVVRAVGPHGSLALAPQVTAPEPFGIMHDLRWIAVFHRSWVGFALELLAFLMFRTALAAIMTRLAWDRDAAPPRGRALLGCALRFVAILALLSSVWIAVLFALAVVSIEWLFLVGVPALLLLAVVTHHGIARPGWWHEAPQLRTTAWLALTFLELSACGAVLATAPAPWLLIPVAVAAGAFNAWAWHAIVHQLTAPRPQARFRPVAPVAIGLLIGATLVGLAVGTARLGGTGDLPARRAAATTPATGPPVLVATGFDTTWDGRAETPLGAGFVQRRFSYRGGDADGLPLPYTATETHRSLGALVRAMGVQVQSLHRATGRDVALVAESEGAMVAAAYVASHPHAPVDDLVMLSPLVAPGRVYYPTAGHEGWGVATGWALRGITGIVAAVSSIDLPADAPLLRSMEAHGPELQDLLRCRPPRIRGLTLVPVTTGMSGPDPQITSASTVLLAFHGGMLGNPAARAAVVRELRDRPARPSAWTGVEHVLGLATAAWQVPALPRALNPAWPPPAPGTAGCGATRRALRAWLG